ncbi:MAG: extracellular matrix regulator RemB [Bacillota bacterium]
MYLHIGGQIVVPLKDLIAVINIEKMFKNNRHFFDLAKLNKKLVKICSQDDAKTCVITDKKIYVSSISTYTITKRIENYQKYD